MIYSQRDPQWAGQRLGTCDGVTIGSDGCYVTAMAQVALHFGEAVNPAQLDDIFTQRGMYVNGCLAVDGMLSQVYPQINYVASYHFENRPADLSVLTNTFEDEFIIEVDFDHDPSDGIQTHFVRFVSWDPSSRTLMIDDPWFGTEDDFRTHYGDQLEQTILKVVHYRGPAQSAPQTEAAPPDPAPDQPPATTDPNPPLPESSTPETSTVVTPPPSQSDTAPTSVEPPSPTPSDNPTPDSTSLPPVFTTTKITPTEAVPSSNNAGMKTKLTSRKFWVAVVSIVYFLAHGQVNQAMAVVLAYLGVEGAADITSN